MLNIKNPTSKMNPKELTSYDYTLDLRLIAQKPTLPKCAAKLLVYNRANDKITHTTFERLWDFIPPKCLIVLNDTKVIRARIYGAKPSGAKIELLYHSEYDKLGRFLVQIRGKVRVGDLVIFSNKIVAKVLELHESGFRVVEFYEFLSGKNIDFINLQNLDSHEFKKLDFSALMAFLEIHGHIPLPPYIKREDNELDLQNYQSVFAKNIGSIAAPTASLHLSEDDMKKIAKRPYCFVSLHIGAGTFFSVEVPDITAHKMHKESFFISMDSANMIMNTSEILCVGTTATRCVEYLAQNFQKSNKDFSGVCDIFINPLNPPIKTSHILTNFHLPKSTLIMLVAGFIGIEKTLEIYQIAQDLEYKFYSYGDGMLIL